MSARGLDTIFTSTGNNTIQFASTLDADGTARTLTVNTGGTTQFDNTVGGTNLTSVTTDAVGTTTINGASVTTTGAQTYNDELNPVTGVTLVAPGGVGFNGKLTPGGDAGVATLNVTGDVTFGASSTYFVTLNATSAITRARFTLDGEPAAIRVADLCGKRHDEPMGASPTILRRSLIASTTPPF